MTEEILSETIIDRKIMNKFLLHKLIANGGIIKVDRFAIRVVYENPNSPYVDIRVIALPLDTKFKGNINPSMVRALNKKNQPKVEIEEDSDIEL